ncbi:MAG TPA: peptide ABC transporter permease [Clostridiaceae bacterium]|jgi:peptide/nickel transport system permease protein|nr:peptide ABC transporter permease [Clostridiaceae bacterium]
METNTEKKVNIKGAKQEDIMSPWKVVWKRLKRDKLAMIGLYTLIILVAVAVIGPFFSYAMEATDIENINAAPSMQHILGTDEVGRDVFARLMYGGRISLSVGIVSVAIEVLIGTILGGIAGYYGGVVDNIIMRLVDILMCFPFLPLLLMLSAVMSARHVDPKYRIYVVMFIIGIIGWGGLCRLIRGQILSLKEQEFMQAAEALGLKDRRKIFRHLLPNTFASIIVSATLSVGGAILTESSLSYLGLGVTPPTPSWGNMIQCAQDIYTLTFQPWRWIPPGVCIFLTVMAINLLGDGLRDALDPKLKR